MSGNARFAVAIHVLSVLGYLHRKGVDLATSSQIAKSVNTNPVVIRNLLRLLKEAGLVASKEGKGGGVRLARKPEAISLFEIYQAVESEDGVFAPNDKPCFKPCPVSAGMKEVFTSVADEVDGAVARVLRGKNLGGVLNRF